MTAGELVRARRAAQGMSQDTLAQTAGISRSMVALIETGRRGVSYQLSRSLAKQLRCKWQDLYTGEVPAKLVATLNRGGC